GRVGVEALVPARDVRRRVRGPADRAGDAPGGGRLSLRPDDVNRRERALRIAEPCEQRAHPLRPEPVLGPRRERLEPPNPGGSHRHETRTDVSTSSNVPAPDARPFGPVRWLPP